MSTITATVNQVGKVLLLIFAHPDDWELVVGGFVSQCFRRGWKIAIIIVTDGAAGGFMPPDKLRQLRRAEAEAAAKLVNADLQWLGIPDGGLESNLKNRLAMIAAIRRARPSLIVTHARNDGHPDHEGTGELVFDSSYLLGVPNVVPDVPPCPPVQVYAAEPFWGVDFNPQTARYVELTAEDMALKYQLIGCHKTEINWLLEHDGIDALKLVEIRARQRGTEAGVEFAEVFIRFPLWPVPVCSDLF